MYDLNYFLPGQVWQYDTRSGEENSTITVLAIDEGEDYAIIHVRIDDIEVGCSGFIQHSPFSAEAIMGSVTGFVKHLEAVPDFKDGYDQWKQEAIAGKAGYWKITVKEAIDAIDKMMNKDFKQVDKTELNISSMEHPELDFSSKERYYYFIKQAIKQKLVWFIEDNGQSVTCRDSDHRSCIPVWPSKELADIFLNEGWETYSPRAVELAKFIQWLPGLADEGFHILVFPNKNFNAYVVPTEKLQADFEKDIDETLS